ncbi:MAG: DegT/DnrJ/EryC1/StrS family aminotransferase [Bacteroidales bacterium]|nr:DegT/DnrJ/EryC1/StrS family aminotransferase [Bacteroidales bacterium]MBR6227026.1 DegT/DnrJ/EryC1/StrS family aminotransferase [Bacteroidales bacterium]
MQFRDLKTQYNVLKDEMDKAILDVVASSAYVMGPKIKEMEMAFADYVGTKHCIACNSGTDALLLALKAWDVKPGDAVFVPSFTFFASAEVIAMQGATPVFVDVDKDTFNIDVADLERKIEQTLKAGKLTPRVVIAVDLFGLPADFKAVRKVADKYHLYVLEDGAQGFGGRIGDKKACTFGDISTTSFFPAKPVGCYGDGGAVFTDNDEWAALMESYHIHGKGSDRYDNVRIGMNSRLDSIQAAILIVKLKAFKDYELVDVNKVAARYTEKLKGVVKTPVVPEGFYSSWAQYTLQLKDKEQRAGLQAALKALDIPTAIYYPIPMHRQTAFSYLNLDDNRCPVSDQLADTVISLPIHPYLNEKDQDLICQVVCDFLKK